MQKNKNKAQKQTDKQNTASEKGTRVVISDNVGCKTAKAIVIDTRA